MWMIRRSFGQVVTGMKFNFHLIKTGNESEKLTFILQFLKNFSLKILVKINWPNYFPLGIKLMSYIIRFIYVLE